MPQLARIAAEALARRPRNPAAAVALQDLQTEAQAEVALQAEAQAEVALQVDLPEEALEASPWPSEGGPAQAALPS